MTRPVRARAALVLVVCLFALGCGVPTDGRPVALTNSSLPEELQLGRLPTPVPTPSDFNFQIYMARGDNRLHVVGRNVPGLTASEATLEETRQNAIAIMEVLLLGTTPEEAAAGIHSALNWRTEMSDLTIEDIAGVTGTDQRTIAHVTLTPQSLQGVVGIELKLALGQIVYSLTTRQTIDGVSFAIGNAPLEVETDSGIAPRGAPVTRDDLTSLDPLARPVPAFDPEPTPTPDAGRVPLVDVQIWLIDPQNQLTPVTRRVARDASEMMSSLTAALPETEVERGLRTLVGPGFINVVVETNDQSANFGTAYVDIDDITLPGYDYEARLLAAAQIVYTLTGLIEVDNVIFIQDDIPIAVPTANGLSTLPEPGDPGLSRQDYAPLYPSSVPTPTPAPTATPP